MLTIKDPYQSLYFDENNDNTNQKINENERRSRIKCGEILLEKNDWQVSFSCEFCGKETEKIHGFLLHTLQHHLSASREQVLALIKEQEDDHISIVDELENSEEFIGISAKAEILDSEDIAADTNSGDEHNSVDNNEKLLPTKEKTNSELSSEMVNFEFLNPDDVPVPDTDENASTLIASPIQTQSVIEKLKSPKTKSATLKKNEELVCKICSKVHKSRKQLIRHVKEHPNSKSFACEFCGATFSQYSNFHVHRNRHLGIKPHRCTVCEKGFVRSTDLKTHMRTHTGERPYSCEECGKSYSTSARYVSHKRSHTNERPFMCTICGKSFYTKDLLRNHEISHSGVRPFSCNNCETTFSRRKALMEHMKLHSDIKKYVCKICSKAFAQQAGLQSHMKGHANALKKGAETESSK